MAARVRRILLLDGESRATLAAVRSLGSRGHRLAVASPKARALSFASRYCSESFVSPDPGYAPDTFQQWLLELVQGWQPDLLLPASDLTLKLSLRIEEQLRKLTVLPTVCREVFEAVTDKSSLLATAARLGVNAPATLLVPEPAVRSEETVDAIRAFRYPAVAKPNSSSSDMRSHFVTAGAAYAASAEELLQLLNPRSASVLARVPFLLQQRVPGSGVGVFALCAAGRPLAVFCHRRLLEKPPTGGRSVLSESIAEEDAPVRDALLLLEHFRWDGVAMVEFKQSSPGVHYLMEINPRFWGSLQLAIDCGRDFPVLLSELACDGFPAHPSVAEQLQASIAPYRTGQRLRWLLGTCDHALLRLRDAPAAALADILLRNSLLLYSRPAATRLEVCRRDDIAPFLRELRQYMVSFIAPSGGAG